MTHFSLPSLGSPTSLFSSGLLIGNGRDVVVPSPVPFSWELDSPPPSFDWLVVMGGVVLAGLLMVEMGGKGDERVGGGI